MQFHPPIFIRIPYQCFITWFAPNFGLVEKLWRVFNQQELSANLSQNKLIEFAFLHSQIQLSRIALENAKEVQDSD